MPRCPPLFVSVLLATLLALLWPWTADVQEVTRSAAAIPATGTASMNAQPGSKSRCGRSG